MKLSSTTIALAAVAVAGAGAWWWFSRKSASAAMQRPLPAAGGSQNAGTGDPWADVALGAIGIFGNYLGAPTPKPLR